MWIPTLSAETMLVVMLNLRMVINNVSFQNFETLLQLHLRQLTKFLADMTAEKSPRSQTEEFKGYQSRKKTKSDAKLFLEATPLIPYGGQYNFDGYHCRLKYTCTVDSFLNLLCGLYLHHQPLLSFMRARKQEDEAIAYMEEAINLALEMNYDKAKLVWVRDLLKIKPKNGEDLGSLLGYLDDQATKFVCKWFKYCE